MIIILNQLKFLIINIIGNNKKNSKSKIKKIIKIIKKLLYKGICLLFI